MNGKPNVFKPDFSQPNTNECNTMNNCKCYIIDTECFIQDGADDDNYFTPAGPESTHEEIAAYRAAFAAFKADQEF